MFWKNYSPIEEESSATCKVISLYRDLETIVRCEEFNGDLQKELQNSNPDFINDIQRRREKMGKTDTYILIAGKPSADISKLVNKILDKNILTSQGCCRSNSVICKIRNCDRIRIITESETGKVEEMDLTDRCDIGTKEGTLMLKESIRGCMRRDNTRLVDVGFPTSVLKGHTMILVEVPEFKESNEYAHQFREYLPNAVSIIIVINIVNDPNMNENLLSFMLNQIHRLRMNDMIYFYPNDIIFMTNGWDSSDKEEDVISIWKKFKSYLRYKWPYVKEKNIFRTNRRYDQFKAFKKVMESTVQKTEHVRIMRHLGFIQNILRQLNAYRILKQMIDSERSETFEMDLIEEHCQTIVKLECNCKQARETLQKGINKAIEQTAQTCYDFMSSDEGKDEILNPPNRPPILQICPSRIPKEIYSLVKKHVNTFLRSAYVLKKFRGIRGEIVSFHHNISLELSKMENELTYDRESNVSVCEALVTSPLCMPGLTISWSQISIPPFKKGIKQNLIDAAYDPYLSLIRGWICNHLKSSYGQVIMELLDTVTNNLLSKRLNHLKKIIDECHGDREKYLRKQKLEKLALDLKRLQKTATELQSSIIYMIQVEEANNGML